MPIVFQAKEQGKAEVEELLSKLEKVTHQSYIHVFFCTCFSVMLNQTMICLFLFSDQFWAASENTWTSGQTVQGTQFSTLILSNNKKMLKSYQNIDNVQCEFV